MTTMTAPPVPLSQVGRAAHDIGLAGLLGGSLFGRLALHPSVTDTRARGRARQGAQHRLCRHGTINSLSLLAVTAGWLARARARPARGACPSPSAGSPSPRSALVGVVAVTGIATAAQGVRFSKLRTSKTDELEATNCWCELGEAHALGGGGDAGHGDHAHERVLGDGEPALGLGQAPRAGLAARAPAQPAVTARSESELIVP